MPGVPLTFIMVLLAGFFSMSYFPPMLSYMPEVVKKPWQVGPATGLNTALGFGGSMLFPYFFGLILDGGQQIPHVVHHRLHDAGRVRGAGHRLDGVLQARGRRAA